MMRMLLLATFSLVATTLPLAARTQNGPVQGAVQGTVKGTATVAGLVRSSTRGMRRLAAVRKGIERRKPSRPDSR
jgi:hypothetical protein